jgi:hypothetical protein
MLRLTVTVMLAIAAAFVWVNRAELLRYIPRPAVMASAHERYAFAIRARNLDETELGRAWLESADAVLEHPMPARAPFTFGGEFRDMEQGAASWRFAARRGQRISVDADFAAGALFLDLFDGDTREHIASADRAPLLTYDVEHDGEFVLRVQPELLRGGPYRIHQDTEALLQFPLKGTPPRAVQGVFGDPRDGGRRRHEGIDIFAPRGTPAVAAVDGWITGAATNRLGGNVVWLWSPAHRVALYYAHLDRQAVSRGQRVHAGDIVGYVGTTGNARGTAPHLHFGIYASGDGAVDPLPYVCDPPCAERLMQRSARTAVRTR